MSLTPNRTEPKDSLRTRVLLWARQTHSSPASCWADSFKDRRFAIQPNGIGMMDTNLIQNVMTGAGLVGREIRAVTEDHRYVLASGSNVEGSVDIEIAG